MEFVNFLYEKRSKHLRELKERIKKLLSHEPLKNLKMCMFAEKYKGNDKEEIIKTFFKNAREKEYFKNMYKKIKGKEFTWNTLKSIKEITEETKTKYDSLLRGFDEVLSAIDYFYAPFLETMKSFPLIYSSGKYPDGFGLDPNCLGAAQTISVLYSYEHNIDDLVFLEVISSKRRNKLLEELKELNKEDCKYHLGIAKFSPEWKDYVCVKFDTFEGGYLKKDLKNMVLEQILGIEEYSHGVIKNKKTNEIYDYEIERENIKSYKERDLVEGIFDNTFSHMLLLMNDLNYPKEIIKENFDKIYKNCVDKLTPISIGMVLFPEKTDEFLDKIKKIYENEEELPAKYHIVDIVYNCQKAFFNKKEKNRILEKIDYLRNKYVSPDALEYLSNKYGFPLEDIEDSLKNNTVFL